MDTDSGERNKGIRVCKANPSVSAGKHSDLMEQRFAVYLRGRVLSSDHQVNGRKILPGAAYLEMARAAVEKAGGVEKEGKTGIRIRNVVWSRPVEAGIEPVKVNIGLIPKEGGVIAYEVYSEGVEGETVVHSQGIAEIVEVQEESKIDIKGKQERKWERVLSPEECYDAFKTKGIEYGPGHRGIEALYVGEGEALARLKMPDVVLGNAVEYKLHPSMLDSAFQSVAGLMSGAGGGILPFALDEMEILRSCESRMWAVLRRREERKVSKFDIEMCDEGGAVCVRVKGLTFRMMEAGAKGEVWMLEPEWKEMAASDETEEVEYAQRIVFLCEPERIKAEEMEMRIKGLKCIELKPERNGERIDERYQAFTERMIGEIRRIIEGKPEGRVLAQAVVYPEGEKRLLTGLMGILKTAGLENPKILGQWIEMEGEEDGEKVLKVLEENKGEKANRIKYREGKRLTEGWKEAETDGKEAEIPWKEGGVYLITGGMGGLGKIFAKEIVEKTKNTALILTGRTELSGEKEVWIKEMEEKGSKVEYRKADVSEKGEAEGLINWIGEKYGKLDGIIHSAGVIRDSYLLKKSAEEVREVLAPKVRGLVNLDEASRGMKLDVFILFSSLTGVMGNVGQADYSAANGFMDAYAGYRNEEVKSKQRSGKTISIDWPLWKEGGMKIDEESEKMMMRQTGMTAMETANGILAFYWYYPVKNERARLVLLEIYIN